MPAKAKQLIQGVQVKHLKWISDGWGKLMGMLSCDDPFNNDIPYD